MSREELKARLVAEAEAIIDRMVGADEGSQPRTLREIEQAALKAGQEIKARLLAGLVAKVPQTTVDQSCPQCGGKLKSKGKRRKWVLTQAGEVEVERRYYYCSQCKTGFFPR